MKKLPEALTDSPLFENRRQSQIYLALLRKGPSGVTTLHAETGIHAETIQRELKKMESLHTVFIETKGRNKKITAASVSQLQELLTEQRENFDFFLKPLLEATSEEQHVKMNAYVGNHQYSLLQLKLIKLQPEEETVFILSTPANKWRATMIATRKLIRYEKIRISKKIQHHFVSFEGDRGQIEETNREYFPGQLAHLKRRPRYIDAVGVSPLAIQVWHSHVVISIFATVPHTHIVFEDKNMRSGMKSYFDVMWKIAKP